MLTEIRPFVEKSSLSAMIVVREHVEQLSEYNHGYKFHQKKQETLI